MKVFPDDVVDMVLPAVNKAIIKLGATKGIDFKVLYGVDTETNNAFLGVSSKDKRSLDSNIKEQVLNTLRDSFRRGWQELPMPAHEKRPLDS